MRKFVLCLVLTFLIANPVNACIGAKQAAMGWAGVASSDDAAAAYWNPSKIPFSNNQVSLDVFYGTYPNKPRLWYTSESFSNNNLGITHGVNVKREYLMISYAFALSKEIAFSAGTSFDFIDREYQGNALILSGTYQRNRLTIACLAQDMNIRPSLAITTNDIIICLEIYDALNYYDFLHVRVGGELNMGLFKFRAGYNSEDRHLTYGFGIKIAKYTVDFAHLKEIYGVSINYTL